MINIISNGSKWAGQEPDSIETLFSMLATEPLDPRFEQYGNFIMAGPEKTQPATLRFWGNFWNIAHVFEIDTNEVVLIEALTKAIRRNQRSAAYLATKDSLR